MEFIEVSILKSSISRLDLFRSTCKLDILTYTIPLSMQLLLMHADISVNSGISEGIQTGVSPFFLICHCLYIENINTLSTAVIRLKYCRYGVKHYPINQLTKVLRSVTGPKGCNPFILHIFICDKLANKSQVNIIIWRVKIRFGLL